LKVYKIRDWKDLFEKAEWRKLRNRWWVAIPVKHDGTGYRRVMAMKKGLEIFGAWVLIVQVASKCRMPGTLADETGPLSARDIASKTGASEKQVTLALSVLTSSEIGWMTAEEYQDDSSRSTGEPPASAAAAPVPPAEGPAFAKATGPISVAGSPAPPLEEVAFAKATGPISAAGSAALPAEEVALSKDTDPESAGAPQGNRSAIVGDPPDDSSRSPGEQYRLHDNTKHDNTEQNKGERKPARPRDVPEGINSESAAVVAYWRAFHQIPSIRTQEAMVIRATDLGAWEQAIKFWEINSYRPESVGKMLDKHDEIVRERRENGPGTGNRATRSGIQEPAERVRIPKPADE
jgi:hypothetical protein